MDFPFERPLELHAYAPPRRTEPAHLVNAALVLFTQGPPAPAHIIKNHLADTLHLSNRNFGAYPAADANYVLKCSNDSIKRRAIQNSPYYLPDVSTFSVFNWYNGYGMQNGGPTHEAWIVLEDAPLQLWDEEEVAKTISGFGFIVRLQAHGVGAGHYRDLRMLIMCAHPNYIPRRVVYHEGPLKKHVQVHIHRCRPISSTPFPPDWNDRRGPPPPPPPSYTHGPPQEAQSRYNPSSHSSPTATQNATPICPQTTHTSPQLPLTRPTPQLLTRHNNHATKTTPKAIPVHTPHLLTRFNYTVKLTTPMATPPRAPHLLTRPNNSASLQNATTALLLTRNTPHILTRPKMPAHTPPGTGNYPHHPAFQGFL